MRERNVQGKLGYSSKIIIHPHRRANIKVPPDTLILVNIIIYPLDTY